MRRGRLRGFGFANYVEANGSLGIARLTTGAAPQEAAAIEFDHGGAATIRVGMQSSGQDHATPLVRPAAVHLGLDPAMIRVREGDGDALPLGGGTGGSRSTLAGLHALEYLLPRLKERVRELCAASWGVPVGAVTCEHGTVRERHGKRSMTIGELARTAPDQLRIVATCQFAEGSFANGCHACEVEIDPETGETAVLAYTAVDDFGTVLDENNVRGQVQGGVAQGVGTALLEACRHDAGSGALLSGSFQSYAIPRAQDVPAVDWVSNGLPSTRTPLGVKACAEAPASVSPPAIMNAIVYALRGYADAGALQMPASPAAVRGVIASGLARWRSADGKEP